MKKIGIVFVTIFMLNSCILIDTVRPDTGSEYTLKIVNKSGFNIVIEAFLKGKMYDRINVENGKYISKKIKFFLLEDDPKRGIFRSPQNPYIFSDEFKGSRDSIIIKFGNTKYVYQNYEDKGSEKNNLYNAPGINPSKLGYYKPKNNTRCYGTYEYRFTKKDYENGLT